ncbi:MAG: RidA family protein [Planctomycetes bacterium]|nr:RidA family protein [Planctomycetota bacterium]
MTRRHHIRSGSDFEKLAGYARAVVVPDPHGDWIFVSGTTGYDYATGTISADPVEQTEQCFWNIGAALAQAGAALDDIVRIRVFVRSRDVFRAIAPVLGARCRAFEPANTTVIAELVEPAMLVEIEVTARARPAPAARS